MGSEQDYYVGRQSNKPSLSRPDVIHRDVSKLGSSRSYTVASRASGYLRVLCHLRGAMIRGLEGDLREVGFIAETGCCIFLTEQMKIKLSSVQLSL